MKGIQHDLIEWLDWSPEAFERAAKERKLILLDLTASWCHWCHVMDSTTYSDPEVARAINDHFVPVRVDIDRRPDISERYHRGGFPTTAFLSDRGESIWGATYVPPQDMKRIIDTMLKTKSSGDIDNALAKARANPRVLRPVSTARGMPNEHELRYLFDAIFATYDVEHGGFGIEPKFPNPDAVDLLLLKYSEYRAEEFADAVRTTIHGMARGLHDDVEGGMFRYSVTADWTVPHYEKMLDGNAEFLLNLARGHAILGDGWMVELADMVGEYMLRVLRDPDSGGFFGSQDADERYYKLGRTVRSSRPSPSVDRTIYAGWNGDASAALIESGVLLGRASWVEAGLRCLDNLLSSLWSAQRVLVKHTVDQELFLFEDQVSLLRALVAAAQQTNDRRYGDFASDLIASAENNFAHPEGGFGDIAKDGGGPGELADPVRSLLSNSNWARYLAVFGAISDRHDLVREARNVLGSFGVPEVEAHGVFASTYLLAADVVSKEPVRIDVHVSARDTCVEAGICHQLRKQVIRAAAVVAVPDLGSGDAEYAVVCGSSGCSNKFYEASEVLKYLDTTRQVSSK